METGGKGEKMQKREVKARKKPPEAAGEAPQGWSKLLGWVLHEIGIDTFTVLQGN